MIPSARVPLLIAIATLTFGFDFAAYEIQFPPALRAPRARFEIQRDAAGRMIRLSLPEGERIQYRFDEGALVTRHGISQGLGQSLLLPAYYLNPDRLPIRTDRMMREVQAVREHWGYEDYRAETVPEFATREGTLPLPAEAARGLLRQFDLLKTCNPALAALMGRWLSEGRIRFSPQFYDAAVVDARLAEETTVYLAAPWVEALSGQGDFTPTLRWMREDTEETREMRKRYFGRETVTLAELGNPSRTWLMLLGLAHEFGHVLQHQTERSMAARDLYTYHLFRVLRLIDGQANFGTPEPGLVAVRERLNLAMEIWKQYEESGATFFALDQLAACPAGLGAGYEPSSSQRE